MPSHDGIASDLVAIINQCIMSMQAQLPQSYAAYVIPGSWNPKTGTVRVQRSHLAAVQSDDGDSPLYDVDLPLLTTAFGHQYGPRGYEPCSIVPRAHGYAVILEHDDATSPNAPSGEQHLVHYAHTGIVDAKLKFTNDGPTANDGKAGIIGLVGALLALATKNGLTFQINDTANTASLLDSTGFGITVDFTNKLVTSGEQSVPTMFGAERFGTSPAKVVSILDANGKTISHVAQQVGLGGLASAIPSTGAIFRKSDITTFSSNIMTQMMQSFSGVYANAMAAAGIPNAGSFAAIVSAAGWITGNITPPTIPTGSSIVKSL